MRLYPILLIWIMAGATPLFAQTNEECFSRQEQEMFDYINAMRQKEGLEPFSYSYHLTHGAAEQLRRAKKNPDSEYVQLGEYSPAYTALAYPFDMTIASRYFSGQSAVDGLFSIPARKDYFFDRVDLKFVSMGLAVDGQQLYIYLGTKDDQSAEIVRCAETQTENPLYTWIRMPDLPYVKMFESEGVVSVRMSYYNWGFIDSTGQMQIPADYHGNTYFVKGLACVINDDKAALINHNNEIVFPFGKYKMIVLDEDNPRMILTEGEKVYLADDKGNILSKACDEIDINGNGYYSFYINDKKGVMDINGKVIMEPKYEEITAYCEGFYPFQQGGKWGFMDRNFKVKLAPKYGGPVAYSFYKGLTHYSVNNKVGFMDSTGKLVIPAIYDEAGMFNNEGHCMVSLKGKYGIIDRSGKLIVPAQYEEIQRDQEDDYWIVKQGGHYGILGNNNQWKLKPEFDEMYFLKGKRYLVGADLSWGMISINF